MCMCIEEKEPTKEMINFIKEHIMETKKQKNICSKMLVPTTNSEGWRYYFVVNMIKLQIKIFKTTCTDKMCDEVIEAWNNIDDSDLIKSKN